jgi:hypothetical protein
MTDRSSRSFFHFGVEIELPFVLQKDGCRNVELLGEKTLVLLHLRVSLVRVCCRNRYLKAALHDALKDRCDRGARRPSDESLRLGRLNLLDLGRDTHVRGIKVLAFDYLNSVVLGYHRRNNAHAVSGSGLFAEIPYPSAPLQVRRSCSVLIRIMLAGFVSVASTADAPRSAVNSCYAAQVSANERMAVDTMGLSGINSRKFHPEHVLAACVQAVRG